MNNHVSREGITRDLEAMKHFGIGTAIIGNIYIDGLPDGPVPILSETWLDLTVFAVREAHRVGIDLGLFNCPGWSEAGGPWIAPEQAMRFLNWSETRVAGGHPFDGILPKPQAQFQDVAVLAVPVPAEDRQTLRQLSPRVEAAGAIDPPLSLFDDNPSTVLRFPPGAAGWTIRIETDEPFTARSLVLKPSESVFRFHAELRAVRGDGTAISIRQFEFVCGNNRLNVGPVPYAPLTVAFPAVTSRRWELVLSEIDLRDPNAEYFPPTPLGERREGLAGMELLAAPRIEQVVEKQLGKMHPTPKPVWDTYHFPERTDSDTDLAIAPTSILNLSDRMTSDGRLRWQAPPGDWVIQRIGMSATGVKNHPGAPNALGLEADKMSREVMVHHFDSFVGRVVARLSAEERQTLKYLGADSYEVGSQNWTHDNDRKFIESFGYDPKPWLAVLSGRVIGSVDQSDRFLWDLRRHVADRIAYDFVGGLTAAAKTAGMKSWVQNYGHWGFPAEFLQYGGQADLLSGEFWVGKDLGGIECRAAASAAHIYGKPVVWAEGFTSADFFERHPYSLKARGDWAFTEGINHLLLQCSMLQYDDRKPGVNAWFGTEINRNNTWYGQGRAWTDYLRRCHLLLQSGRNVANVAIFIGEDAPAMTGPTRPVLPAGYAFDFINAEVIRDRLSVQDGRFVLPDATGYDLLVLPAIKTIRPEVLAKIGELVRAGGVILGMPPERSPSLVDYPRADVRVRELAAELWSGTDRFGAGRVFTGDDIAVALSALALTPDVSGIDPRKVLWVHRSTPDAELYFVSNQTDEPMVLSPIFRVTGRMPELWDAVKGTVTPTARHATTGAGTRVDFSLGCRGSIFVVFPRKLSTALAPVVSVQHEGQAATDVEVLRADEGLSVRVERNGVYRLEREQASALEFEVDNLPEPHTLREPWQLRFPPGMDTPAVVTLDTLIPWNEHSNEAIRHFSGTATYATTFDLPTGWIVPGRRIWLELGRVEVIADVVVNGRDLGTAWLPPYRVDVTDAVRAGGNLLEVRATNLWRNRIIGDLKYPDGFPDGPRPKQFKTELFTLGWWKRDEVLQPSGLLGPMRLMVSQDVPIKTR